MTHMKTETPQQQRERFKGYYLDFLSHFDRLGEYAAYHNLTLETARLRIDIGKRVYKQTAIN